MDHRGQLDGIDLPGTVSPECLAVVRYWDRDGNVQASSVLPYNAGWDVGVERRRQGATWRAANRATGIA